MSTTAVAESATPKTEKPAKTKSSKTTSKKSGKGDGTVEVVHQEIEIDQIVADKATQCRVQMDDNVVTDYAETIASGVGLPPITVMRDPSKAEPTYYVVDGWHRLGAHRKAGLATIYAYVAEGSAIQALDLATRANSQHGLRRTNADKRRAVELAIQVDKQLKRERSNRQIAEDVGVHHSLVDDVQAEISGKQTRKDKDKKKEGATPPPPDEATADPDTSGTDKAGNRITHPSVTEAIAALPTFDAIVGELKAARERVVQLAGTGPGALLNMTQIDRDIEAVIAAIKWAKPHAQCTYGANKLCDDSCKACRGRHWINEETWDRIPDSIKSPPEIDQSQPPV